MSLYDRDYMRKPAGTPPDEEPLSRPNRPHWWPVLVFLVVVILLAYSC